MLSNPRRRGIVVSGFREPVGINDRGQIVGFGLLSNSEIEVSRPKEGAVLWQPRSQATETS
jgi:hypothetical protein